MAAIPAWKLAILERKKKQQEEEDAKKAQAEEARLASLPAWRRAIILREKQGPAQAQGAQTDKWQVAVERVKGPDSPILNKKTWDKTATAASNSPLADRKKTTTTASNSLASNSPLANRKPWNQTATTASNSPLANRKPWNKIATTASNSPLAVTTVTSNSPLSDRKPWNTTASNKKAWNKAASFSSADVVTSDPSKKAWNKITTSNEKGSPLLEKKKQESGVSSPSQVKKLSSQSFSGQSASKNQVINRWKHQLNNKKTDNIVSENRKTNNESTKSCTEVVDPSLEGLPPWKKALILKKRRAQQGEVESNAKGEDETDSGPPAKTEPALATPASTAPVQVQRGPDVVNRSNDEDSSSQRLVEQEGKTLRPPVYKEVDQWANVNEEDAKFKALPLWKQALIKRRRADIAHRSGLSTTTASTDSSTLRETKVVVESKNKKVEPKITSTGVKSSLNGASDGKKKVLNKSTTEKKRKQESATKNKLVSKQQTAKEVEKSSSAKSNTKPVRRAPAPPSSKSEEPMFTYKFSHHKLDTGGSSDSTDSELEDAIVTNLDESSSDEDDSGIVLQSYTTSKTSTSPKLGAKSISDPSVTPIVPTSGSTGKKKKMRRVSWSDTNLVSEHYYPKYDYSDYEEIEQKNHNSSEDVGFSHKLHPSLRPVNTQSDPYKNYTNFSTAPMNGMGSEGSLSTFTPSSLSSYAPRILAGYSDINTTDTEDSTPANTGAIPEEQTEDFYADVTSNTAALLW